MKQNIYDHPEFFKGYTRLRESGLTYNDFVEQPAMYGEIFDLKGKSVLDIGCGTGNFSKYCVDQGASNVIAVDISNKMIEKARSNNNNERIDFVCMPIEDVDFPNESFDLIISSLALHYIEDYAGLVKKITFLLKKDGEFIFSTEHPIVTARKQMDNWEKNDEGDKLHWALDHYQEEGKRRQHWYVDGVIKYHRTISTLINTLILSGLVIEKIIEPQSTSDGLEKIPKLISEKRRPSFIIIKSKKL